MSGNPILEFWSRQNESAPLSPDQLAAIKETFGVAGRLEPVDIAPGYAVSDDGRVFSAIPCSWRKDCPRELRQTTTKYGYRMVRLHVNKKDGLAGVHVLMGRAFLPPPAEGQDRVRHLDGDPAHNIAGNLAWGTAQENAEDMVRHGRSLKGMRSPQAKLNDRRVILARGLHDEGFSDAAIAILFGVHPETIRRACNGEQWGHIE